MVVIEEEEEVAVTEEELEVAMEQARVLREEALEARVVADDLALCLSEGSLKKRLEKQEMRLEASCAATERAEQCELAAAEAQTFAEQMLARFPGVIGDEETIVDKDTDTLNGGGSEQERVDEFSSIASITAPTLVVALLMLGGALSFGAGGPN